MAALHADAIWSYLHDHLVLQWDLDGHLRTTSGDLFDTHLPAEPCCSLCDRPRDEVGGRRIRPVVDDPHGEIVVPARKCDAGTSGLRVPPDVAQSFHDHLEYFGDEPVVDMQIRSSLNLHDNMSRLGKSRGEALHGRQQNALALAVAWKPMHIAS